MGSPAISRRGACDERRVVKKYYAIDVNALEIILIFRPYEMD